MTKRALTIVETSVFTRRIGGLMEDDDYRLLQVALAVDPGMGVIVPGSGGIRKVRWKLRGTGKRGGARVIYYWARKDETILMLFAFAKNERADLTKDQLKALRQTVEREFR